MKRKTKSPKQKRMTVEDLRAYVVKMADVIASRLDGFEAFTRRTEERLDKMLETASAAAIDAKVQAATQRVVTRADAILNEVRTMQKAAQGEPDVKDAPRTTVKPEVQRQPMVDREWGVWCTAPGDRGSDRGSWLTVNGSVGRFYDRRTAEAAAAAMHSYESPGWAWAARELPPR